jgi:hypothetical protein
MKKKKKMRMRRKEEDARGGECETTLMSGPFLREAFSLLLLLRCSLLC